ncbi:hypothetical protein HY29_15625 [Hyphomonas beringensis]|uniref:DZANK-type domain-containing protein n=1 Tax=Hyphomonas beringensis TaxID=1280946 RepID=A0A062U1K6_9PROT|nr:hypothetical protein [Hyphomonas beringensis]KCZ54171.1 hypothetical protein HY29_15625 [Hyphomonas beringensis]
MSDTSLGQCASCGHALKNERQRFCVHCGTAIPGAPPLRPRTPEELEKARALPEEEVRPVRDTWACGTFTLGIGMPPPRLPELEAGVCVKCDAPADASGQVMLLPEIVSDERQSLSRASETRMACSGGLRISRGPARGSREEERLWRGLAGPGHDVFTELDDLQIAEIMIAPCQSCGTSDVYGIRDLLEGWLTVRRVV